MIATTILRFQDRAIGKIAPATHMAYERIVHLPMDLAVFYSALQNFRLDLAKGCFTCMADWQQVCVTYMHEALAFIQEDGCNLYPGDNALPWIHVKQIATPPLPSERVMKLKLIVDYIFCSNDTKLLDGEYYPTPSTAIKYNDIVKLYLGVAALAPPEPPPTLH